jgi:hypothetical protein
MKLDSISQWCLYRERSIFETQTYLIAKGISKMETEHILKYALINGENKRY